MRPMGRELIENAWPKRWDISSLIVVFAFTSLSNAFGMTPPFYELQIWLARTLRTTNEPLLLAIVFAVLSLLLPAAVGLGAAWLSRASSGHNEPLRVTFSRYAPAFAPLAFAIWLAHYTFHFAIGALTIIPVIQAFAIDHGLTFLGAEPNWQLGPILSGNSILPLQTFIILAGFAGSLLVGNRIPALRRAAQCEPLRLLQAPRA